MSMTITHGAVTLAPTSLARDGMESSGPLETCLAALLMSSVADSVLMNAVDLSTYTWEPPYRFINADVSLPDPDPEDWTRPMPQGIDARGADSTSALARILAADMDADHACAEAMAFSRAMRVANADPHAWALALAQTADGPVEGLSRDPLHGWCSTLARNGRRSGPAACAIAEAIRDGHWGARSVSNVRGGTLEIPARVWLGLEAERGRMEFPFDEAPDDEPDDGLFPAYRNGHADIQMQLSGDRQNA